MNSRSLSDAPSARPAVSAAAPIGIFDSGVGGLTVARSLIDLMPHESVLYVGDTQNSPYGPLPIAEVRANALGIMDQLVSSGVKALVIACNTASAAVLGDARERYTGRYGIPVVEVIRPAVRRAAAATRNGRIGVVATAGTVRSRAYEDTFAAAPHLEVFSAACPRFVEFVEAGVTSGPELIRTAEEYVAPLKEAGVDTLILGCTHYPLLTGVLSLVMGEDVTLISSAEETAKDVYRSLVREGIQAPDTAEAAREFMATGSAAEFEVLARRFLGPEVASVTRVEDVHAIYPTASIARITPAMLEAAARLKGGESGQGKGARA